MKGEDEGEGEEICIIFRILELICEVLMNLGYCLIHFGAGRTEESRERLPAAHRRNCRGRNQPNSPVPIRTDISQSFEENYEASKPCQFFQGRDVCCMDFAFLFNGVGFGLECGEAGASLPRIVERRAFWFVFAKISERLLSRPRVSMLFIRGN